MKFKGCQGMSGQKYVDEKVKFKALEKLTAENSTKTKTKHIIFETLEMRNYLRENINTTLSKTIFSVRAGTLDLKVLNEWKYENNKCVMCEIEPENIDHFMNCMEYGHGRKIIDWKEIYLDDVNIQVSVDKEVKRRQFIRKEFF